MAGLAAPGVTTVIENEASRDHTELMLRHFGAQIATTPEGSHGRRIELTGQPELHGEKVVVPADARDRWMSVEIYDKQPMSPRLSGLSLEYRILAIYSRDRGQRSEALDSRRFCLVDARGSRGHGQDGQFAH